MCEQAVLNKRKDMRKEVYDMKVLEIIMPVLVMILLGIWCRKKNVLTQSGRNHVCDASDFFFGWIFTETIIGRAI